MKDLISRQGLSYREKKDTLHTMCPACQQDDKLSILKRNGATICYRGKCNFGRKWFEDWLSLTANIPLKQARQMVREETVANEIGPIRFDPFKKEDPLQPIGWPPANTVAIDKDFENDGSLYLESRGITPVVAEKYGIRYNVQERRVVFPIFLNGTCYGYQGRAIDNVDKHLKMRNNPGFRRHLLVMFWDLAPIGGDLIIVEGPVDGIKFDKVGGALPTMGKEISSDQVKLIMKKKPKRVFLALDDDAFEESDRLKNKIFGPELYTLEVPKSARDRCEALGKKADFGECTFDECAEAVRNAERVDRLKLNIKLR
jgi:Zn ribbon nucleic-acid-binding protein